MRTRRPSGSRSRETAAPRPDAIELLMRGHHEVDELFAAFENASPPRRPRLAAQICLAVAVHSRIEQDLFYPEVCTVLGGGSVRALGEAMVEHAIIKMLIDEILAAEPDDVLFEARFKVLRGCLAWHAVEAERALFPRVRESGIDLRALGVRLARRQLATAALLKSEWATRRPLLAVKAPRRASRSTRLHAPPAALPAR